MRAARQIRHRNENPLLPSPRLLLTKTRSTPTRSSPVVCSKNTPYPFIEQENKKRSPVNSEMRDSKIFNKKIDITSEYISPKGSNFRCTPTGLTTVKSVENLRATKKPGTPVLNLSRIQSPKRNFIKSPDFPSTSLNKYGIYFWDFPAWFLQKLASSDVAQKITSHFQKEDLLFSETRPQGDLHTTSQKSLHEYQILPADPRYKIIESIIRENLIKLNTQFFPFTIFQDFQNQKYTILFKETFSIICPECLKILCFQLSFQYGLILICRTATCSGKILYSNDISRKARSELWTFGSNGSPCFPTSETLKTSRNQKVTQEALADMTSYHSKLVKRQASIRGRNLKQNKEITFTGEKDRVKFFMQNKRPLENIDFELVSKKYQTSHNFFTRSPRGGLPANKTPTISSIQRITTNLPTTRDDLAEKIDNYLNMEMSRASNTQEERAEACSLEKKGKIREPIYSKLTKPAAVVHLKENLRASFQKKSSTSSESGSDASVDGEEEEHYNMKSIFNFNK